MIKRTVYADGWHTRGDLDFLVEDGRLIRGVWRDSQPVYPYQYDRFFKCKVNVSGIRATYGVLNRVEWH